MFDTTTKALKAQPLLDAGFEIKGDKQWPAREGYGYSFNVYFGGKKVAYYLDEGNGGMARVEWKDMYRDAKELLEAAALEAHPIHEFFGSKDITTDSYVMEETVNHLLMELSCVAPLLRKCAKGQTVYAQTFAEAIEGSFYVMRTPFNSQIKMKIVAKFPNAVILNDAVTAS